MWFKNLKLYRISQTMDFQETKLQEQLEEFTFRPCGSQETASMGWSTPLSKGDMLFHAADGRIWLTLKKQERILPSAVINAALAEKVEQIEIETGSPVSKKAQQDIKQQIIQQLLPRAFTKNTFIHGFISVKDKIVVVDSSSDGSAEAFLAYLRKSIGSLPVVPWSKRNIQADITLWLSKDNIPMDVVLLEEAELRSAGDEGSIVRVKNQDLGSEEIQHHLDAGKMVSKLAIEWAETLTAVLNDDVSIKRLKFSDVFKEQNEDIPKDQLHARLDADFALMSGEVVRFAHRLDEIFNLSADNI